MGAEPGTGGTATFDIGRAIKNPSIQSLSNAIYCYGRLSGDGHLHPVWSFAYTKAFDLSQSKLRPY